MNVKSIIEYKKYALASHITPLICFSIRPATVQSTPTTTTTKPNRIQYGVAQWYWHMVILLQRQHLANTTSVLADLKGTLIFYRQYMFSTHALYAAHQPLQQ